MLRNIAALKNITASFRYAYDGTQIIMIFKIYHDKS